MAVTACVTFRNTQLALLLAVVALSHQAGGSTITRIATPSRGFCYHSRCHTRPAALRSHFALSCPLLTLSRCVPCRDTGCG